MEYTLRNQLDLLCSDFVMTTSTAINVFVRAVVQERRIPAEIASPVKPAITRESAIQAFQRLRAGAKVNNLQDMTPDEINEEIRLARTEQP